VVTNGAPASLDQLRAAREAGDEGDLFDPQCPTRLVLDRIGDKWTSLVVLLLSDGRMRFTDLRGRIGRVAPKVLTQTLRRMERDGLISREIFAEVPPRVEYSLTDLGRSLIEPIAVIADWAEVNVHRIVEAQRAYDAAHGG
jgi:DNA-binding HxlR family transcriptional regulator